MSLIVKALANLHRPTSRSQIRGEGAKGVNERERAGRERPRKKNGPSAERHVLTNETIVASQENRAKTLNYWKPMGRLLLVYLARIYRTIMETRAKPQGLLVSDGNNNRYNVSIQNSVAGSAPTVYTRGANERDVKLRSWIFDRITMQRTFIRPAKPYQRGKSRNPISRSDDTKSSYNNNCSLLSRLFVGQMM